MILDFDVVFEEPNTIHFSGEEVRGHVVLTLDSPLNLRCIMVKFVGESKYRIPSEFITTGLQRQYQKQSKKKTKRKTRNNKVGPAPTTTDVFHIKKEEQVKEERQKREMRVHSETYFDKTIYLFGHKYSSYREHLSKGVHKFPFKYKLPTSLPSAFNGRFSYIQYYCEAEIERWDAPIEKRRTYFSVSSIADVNNEPKAEMDYVMTRTTSCWLLCCPRGTIVVTARLDKLGVVPGQIVPLEIDVYNMSNIFIDETFISVIQVISHFNNHGMLLYEDERIVVVNKKGPVRQGDSVIWASPLKLPPLPPTSFGHIVCKILSISYKLQIQVELSRKNNPIIIKMPLIIGNIPLKKEFHIFTSDSNFDVDNQIKMPNIFKKMPEFPTVWSSLPSSTSINEDTTYPKKFIPRYPLYRHYHQQTGNHVLSNCINEVPESNNVTTMTDII